MTDTMTITGLVATPPRHIITAEGLAVTSFRLASNLRRFDRKRNEWVDAGTNWYTVSSYRQLALNIVDSVHKGDRVLVTGRLRIREWADGEKKGLNIDLDADALGHDLSWGKSAFTRSIRSTGVEAIADTTSATAEFDAGEPDAEEPDEAEPGAGEAAAGDLVDGDSSAVDPAVTESRLEPATPF